MEYAERWAFVMSKNADCANQGCWYYSAANVSVASRLRSREARVTASLTGQENQPSECVPVPFQKPTQPESSRRNMCTPPKRRFKCRHDSRALQTARLTVATYESSRCLCGVDDSDMAIFCLLFCPVQATIALFLVVGEKKVQMLLFEPSLESGIGVARRTSC